MSYSAESVHAKAPKDRTRDLDQRCCQDTVDTGADASRILEAAVC